MRPTKAIINLQAITHNLNLIKRMAPKSRVMAVVKADAYGHGIVQVAQHLNEVDAFAVACIEEAIQLREGGITQPIILLEGCFEQNEIALIEQYQLETVIHRFNQIEWLKTASTSASIPVWIKLDSHMNRLGFNANEFVLAFEQLKSMSQVESIQLMTHFACADDIENEKTLDQLALFKRLTDNTDLARTAANSAAVLAWPETHFEWIRPGLLIYGCSPMLDAKGTDHHLLPAMTLESKIIAIKEIEAGETVGYGAHWQAEQDTTLAIVAIGYGDGYPRHAKNGTPVWVNGRTVPLAGRVSMDMIAVDLGPHAKDQVDDKVILWGPELPVETVAKWADTIPYTLLCGVTSRVKFSWLE